MAKNTGKIRVEIRCNPRSYEAQVRIGRWYAEIRGQEEHDTLGRLVEQGRCPIAGTIAWVDPIEAVKIWLDISTEVIDN